MSMEKQLEAFHANRALIEAQATSFRNNPIEGAALDRDPQTEPDTLSIVQGALQSSLRQMVSDLEAVRQAQPPDPDKEG